MLGKLIASAILVATSALAVADAIDVRDDVRDEYSATTELAADHAIYVGKRPYLAASREGAHWARFVPLTQPTRIDRGRLVLTVDPDAGELKTLELFNNTGRSQIARVVVDTADGAQTSFAFDRPLTSKAPLTLDLGTYRRVQRVTVYGHTAAKSAFQLLGR